jgi:hypothetical protein
MQLHCIKTLNTNHRHCISQNTVATVMQQIMTELSEAMSEEDRIMVITKMVLNETKKLLKFISHSKSNHLMQMAFGGSTMSSVNSCKISI